MSEKFDWSQFTVRIDIAASKASIYEAWTSQEMLELWFLRLAEFTRPDGTIRDRFHPVEKGDAYKWLWHGYGDESAEYGSIQEANGENLFRFSFGKAGICTVRILEEEEQNILELVQDHIPTDEHGQLHYHLGCKTGWTFYFANIKSLLEGGIDLRNRNEKLKRMINS